MSDITEASPQCAPCPGITVPATDPLSFLRRLPETLFNRQRPSLTEIVARFPVTLDVTIFGPLFFGGEPTPQWEIARIFCQEKDLFRLEWARVVAMQLGLGHMEVLDGKVTGECPRAAGGDLDVVGEQYGIARPFGFTDCCYWRLVLLMLFKPGPTSWLIRELGQLYTGIRPTLIETPDKITLVWPSTGGEGYFDTEGEQGAYADDDGYYDGNVAMSPAEDHQGYADVSSAEAGAFFAGDYEFRGAPPGMTLEHAVAAVKAAGIWVAYQNRPRSGYGGCFGASYRSDTIFGNVFA
jgi:hypothetical protein